MKQYYIFTYGCQMNESDSERLAHQLELAGYTSTDNFEEADLIILNTCCVRETAEHKIYGRIGELKHLKAKNKNLIIAITGCMAQKNQADMFKRAPHIDIVLGTHNLRHINEMVAEVQRTHKHQINIEMDNSVLHELEAKPTGTFSAWVPIMNGCNKFCTYCIVPHVRGREISRPISAIVEDVKKLGASGHKEITLLGQNVNSYGLDFKDGTHFGDLIDALDGIPGIERIRYMTSHPQDMNKEMIDALGRSSNVVTQLHLPIQSGSNRILQKMNRRYTVEHYKELIDYCREKIKGLTLTTDLIVGFPGETEEDFQATLQLLKDVRYDMAYTFIFSKRSGTPAATMADQVPEEVKRVRLQALMDVQNEISLELNKAMEGEIYEIIVEGPSRNDENVWFGRTSGNKMILFPKDESLAIGQTVKARVDKAQTWILYGTVVS
ncbi:tRNA (N6-isopentenyl adenosine(37)-C2)-methylthiotransferase MiaB [Veillonella sp. R32]|uniref:tRNA (N6-isopentenyl adenosine(37)-C2)-methylthiotransferase MiaB n=1 Tax=Veillonella sp. R32 TaxID=2021312 RepID=UPI001389FE5F|nr:tRNA (N6-isopentenyl adenosine(37)-C2)-methylthiotransferase MiaB [Veillonella sp. R32]KAF1683016.1 tRNA (N6-isopentenyl adenosine(37)-C2)-methylthiotransferase MiaB [Veillonella sp. R32]